MNSQDAEVLRCWKCRKYVANSNCLIKCHGKQQCEFSTDAQNTCNVWHMNLEDLPDWVKCAIEKAQWTIGKLNCPFCGARLGGFNFVRNTKCSCGQFVNIHFCKSRTDFQPACSIKLPRSSVKHLSLCKAQSGFNKKIQHKVTGGTLEIRNPGIPCMTKNYSESGRLTEALCLEVQATNFDINSRKPHFKVFSQKKNLSASWPVNDMHLIKAFHRKSHSLDLNIREKLVLLPNLCGTSGNGPIYHRQNDTQPIYPSSNLQLESSRENSFQGLYSFDADELSERFSVTSCNALTRRGTECECGFQASEQCSGSATADQLPFVMDLFPSANYAEDDDTGQENITPIDQEPASISLVTVHQKKLSKRERNKLKSLRRKQRRRERWLQKQLSNDNVNTDDDHEHRGDKESYLCAVCLDVYFNPYMCYPCHHIFCEPCLRMLAKDNPTSTPCPLCRTIIARVFFQSAIPQSMFKHYREKMNKCHRVFGTMLTLQELNNSTKSFFPSEYLKLKENFQKSSSAKWPLPSCRKAFRVFEAGFQRHADPVARRHFPHAAHRMDYMDFEDDSRGWRFDMDMVIIYIYSVNWVIGFIIFCFLCYFFFPF